MKRLLPLILLLALLAGACDQGSECGPFDSRFVTTGFSPGTFVFAPSDTTFIVPPLAPVPGDTVLYSDFVIRLRAQVETFSASNARGPSFSLTTPAHACDVPDIKSEEVVRDIRIFSDTDFNADYPAGENLAPLFDVRVPIHLTGSPYERFDLESFLATNPNSAGDFLLMPDEAPARVDEFRFTVEFEQESETLEDFTFQTAPVVLRPGRAGE